MNSPFYTERYHRFSTTFKRLFLTMKNWSFCVNDFIPPHIRKQQRSFQQYLYQTILISGTVLAFKCRDYIRPYGLGCVKPSYTDYYHNLCKFLPCQWASKDADCFPCCGVRTPSKRDVLNMTLNCIWWWGSSSVDPISGEYVFIGITLKSIWIRNDSTCQGPIYESSWLVLWYINPCGLFNTKSCLYIYIYIYIYMIFIYESYVYIYIYIYTICKWKVCR